jgi:hypothetical protein
MEIDPPIEMVHPEALLAAIEQAKNLGNLKDLFGDSAEYQKLALCAGAFLDAVKHLIAAEQTPEALRAASAPVNQTFKAMHDAEAPFFRLVWRRAIAEALRDPSGFTARGVLGQILGVRGVIPEHVEALWRIQQRSDR